MLRFGVNSLASEGGRYLPSDKGYIRGFLGSWRLQGAKLKTYVFRVVVEPDEDRWHAYCPVLEKYGAATWGYTQEQALNNIREVVEMVVEELREEK